MQSKRGIIPEVKAVMTMKEAIDYSGQLDVKIIPYELAENMSKTKELFGTIKPGESVGIFIGPEGGFEENEIIAATEKGITPITLGKRILRTETAALTVLSWLMYHFED